MSTIASVDPVDGADYYGVNSVTTKSDLDMASFMKLLVVQLQNQNPLEPMSDSDFYAQLAQMGTVQGVENMSKTSEANQAASLLGKTVTATRPMTDNNSGSDLSVTGIVKKTMVKNGVNYIGIQESDGGIVECKVANITAVEKTTDLSSYSNLIGKTVYAAVNSGTSTDPIYTAVTGTVSALFMEDGIGKAQITGTDSKVYEVELETISGIKT